MRPHPNDLNAPITTSGSTPGWSVEGRVLPHPCPRRVPSASRPRARRHRMTGMTVRAFPKQSPQSGGFRYAAGPQPYVSLLGTSSPPHTIDVYRSLSSSWRNEHGVASVDSPSPQPSFVTEGPAHSVGGGFQTGTPLLIDPPTEAACDHLAEQWADESTARGPQGRGEGCAFVHSPRVATIISRLI